MEKMSHEEYVAQQRTGVAFYDDVIRFGPGSVLKFGVALDKTGKIESLSFG